MAPAATRCARRSVWRATEVEVMATTLRGVLSQVASSSESMRVDSAVAVGRHAALGRLHDHDALPGEGHLECLSRTEADEGLRLDGLVEAGLEVGAPCDDCIRVAEGGLIGVE